MTVVQPDDLAIRTSALEEQLCNVDPGQRRGHARRISRHAFGRQGDSRAASFPSLPNTYDARFKLTDDEPDALAGARHDVQDPPDDVLQEECPAGAVEGARCPTNARSKVLRLVVKSDGTNEKVPVVVGKWAHKKVEILEGLTRHRVLQDPPQD